MLEINFNQVCDDGCPAKKYNADGTYQDAVCMFDYGSNIQVRTLDWKENYLIGRFKYKHGSFTVTTFDVDVVVNLLSNSASFNFPFVINDPPKNISIRIMTNRYTKKVQKIRFVYKRKMEKKELRQLCVAVESVIGRMGLLCIFALNFPERVFCYAFE